MSSADGAVNRGSADLDALVRDGGGDWSWEEELPAARASSAVLHTLRLTSQRWRGLPWTHRLYCILPEGAGASSRCFLYVTGSGDHAGELALLEALALRIAAPVAVLADVPNQPLFGDLREDALIAHTFDRFLEDGDPSWPLLLPMTRAAVRAMDALQTFLAARVRVDGFVVAGASKRGWTTYLAGAADPRVRAIAPMVYDNLDMRAQLRRQRDVFDGGYSPEIADYTDRGLLERIEAPGGDRLLAMVDPFAHRARLTMPKWLILGTNDPYWPVDALGLYHDALPAPTYVTYIPNAGHGLGQPERMAGALSALWDLSLGGDEGAGGLAPLRWELRREADRVRVRVDGPASASPPRLWASSQPTMDFREARWSPGPALAGGPPWTVEWEAQPGVYRAAFLEVEAQGHGGRVALDTPIWTVDPAPSRAG